MYVYSEIHFTNTQDGKHLLMHLLRKYPYVHMVLYGSPPDTAQEPTHT